MSRKQVLKFLTPDSAPEERLCRSFSIPNETRWLGTFIGALIILADPDSWEQFGDLTPDEAAEAYGEIIANGVPGEIGECDEACPDCDLPGGKRIFRLNELGNIEMLDNGEWVPPDGENTIPAIPAREEPTEQERKCLAAANAANVLEQVYEEVSDAVAESASTGEAQALMVTIAVILIGGWIGLIMDALVILAFALFKAFLDIAVYMTADLWDAQFTEKLRCILYDCATDDAGVVTFDFQCVRDGMAQYTEIADPAFIDNIRLFGQVDFMLYVIGVDGLNAAGATTEITEQDCSDCACEAILEAGDWGTVEDIGSGRWRVTSTDAGGGEQKLQLHTIGDVCWCYCDVTNNYGSPSYQDWVDCADEVHIGQPGDCGNGVADSDIKFWFLFHADTAFQFDISIFCNEGASPCP